MIIFVVALQVEAENLINNLKNSVKTNILDKICYEGILEGISVAVAISGVGKVNASLTTQAMIDKYKPKCVINFGTCGGINNTVKHLSYYLVDKACQFDFDLSEIDNVSVGFIEEYNTTFFNTFLPKNHNFDTVTLASADRFSNKKQDIDLISELGCNARDMEGGAISQVCTANSLPLIILKGVTDIYGSNTNDYYKSRQAVCNGFLNKILQIIKLLEFY